MMEKNNFANNVEKYLPTMIDINLEQIVTEKFAENVFQNRYRNLENYVTENII